MVKKLKFREHTDAPKLLRLDLGAGLGRSTPEGFTPVDLHAAKGVKKVNLLNRWPWGANSVDEAHCANLLHYFDGKGRVHFVNELYRVLKPQAKAQIVVPYWAACKAYGDVRVQSPPVTEAWFAYLSKPWREAQNYRDDTGYTCNFDATLSYGLHPTMVTRNIEYQQNGVQFWKEAAQDLIATITKS